jgi:hypothetical protein
MNKWSIVFFAKADKITGGVGLLCHFSLIAGRSVRPGLAMACEAKSTERPVGSTTVRQVRNFKENC